MLVADERLAAPDWVEATTDLRAVITGLLRCAADCAGSASEIDVHRKRSKVAVVTGDG